MSHMFHTNVPPSLRTSLKKPIISDHSVCSPFSKKTKNSSKTNDNLIQLVFVYLMAKSQILKPSGWLLVYWTILSIARQKIPPASVIKKQTLILTGINRWKFYGIFGVILPFKSCHKIVPFVWCFCPLKTYTQTAYQRHGGQQNKGFSYLHPRKN